MKLAHATDELHRHVIVVDDVPAEVEGHVGARPAHDLGGSQELLEVRHDSGQADAVPATGPDGGVELLLGGEVQDGDVGVEVDAEQVEREGA